MKAASALIVVCGRPDKDCVIRDREYVLFDLGLAAANTAVKLFTDAKAAFDKDDDRFQDDNARPIAKPWIGP